MNLTIKNRWTDTLIFECDAPSMRLALEMAVKQKVSLSDAILRGAILRGADLSGADLSGADLSDAILSGADLSDADLSGAFHCGADLSDAILRGASLSGANLSGADLSGADLSGADLSGAILSGADLTPVRDDFWAILSGAPSEVGALRAALIEGRVDGSTYTGDCACLVGTIAKARNIDIGGLGSIKPNASRPAERFFLHIRKGDTPKNNQASKLVVEWLDEWVTNVSAAFQKSEVAK